MYLELFVVTEKQWNTNAWINTLTFGKVDVIEENLTESKFLTTQNWNTDLSFLKKTIKDPSNIK